MGIASRAQDVVTKCVLTAFCTRFIPGGRTLWIAEGSEERVHSSRNRLARLRIGLALKERLPDIAVHDTKRRRLILIDVARFGSQMTTQRCDALSRALRSCGLGLVFVTAYESRREFGQLALDSPWGTIAWFADEPDHVVQFDSGRVLLLQMGQ